MKKEFSTAWKGSKRPGKQRKFRANAPLHIKRKFLSANISKTLRSKYKKRSIPLRKGDIVQVMRGSFKGKKGKVTGIKTKMEKIYVEKIQVKKRDGSSANVPLKASNLQITELNLDDRKRLKGKMDSPKGGGDKEKNNIENNKASIKRDKKINNIKKKT